MKISKSRDLAIEAATVSNRRSCQFVADRVFVLVVESLNEARRVARPSELETTENLSVELWKRQCDEDRDEIVLMKQMSAHYIKGDEPPKQLVIQPLTSHV
jgi:hypothetical protein